MDIKQLEQTLYIALRFKPEYYGIRLASDGWTNINNLIYRINFLHGSNVIDRPTLNQIVKNNPKFKINAFKTKIKANVVQETISRKIKRTIPPDILYYQGTGKVDKKNGIRPAAGEQYIVLKSTYPTSENCEFVLKIDSRKMFAAGYVFFIADNGDILTSVISPKFIIGVEKGD